MMLTENIESNRTYIDHLYSNDKEQCLAAVIQLKNSVIGSNKQKSAIIQMGIVPRLLLILRDDNSGPELLVDTAVTLGSLAKGVEANIQGLIDAGVIPLLLGSLHNGNKKYVEACLRCLRSIFCSPCTNPELLYADVLTITRLVHLIPISASNQEAISTIFNFCCTKPEHQFLLASSGAVDALALVLSLSTSKIVQMPILNCLSAICRHNPKVSDAVATCEVSGRTIPDLLVQFLSRDKTTDLQLAASKCLTHMCRNETLAADNPKIMFKTLPCLIRLCKKENDVEERISAAETLAYLIEVDTELQRIAAISDHLIATLSSYLKFVPDTSNVKKLDAQLRYAQEMRQSGLKAFASLGANDEGIRKRIIETDSLMEHVVNGLSDPNIKIRLASVRCLHSLSRSVQQLRTTFQDHAVWKPLMKLMHNAPDDILTAASSALCNLLLEFSPSKEPILDSGAVDMLCELTRHPDPALRLNGIWALMNMAFQAEQKIKSQILSALSTDQIFRLLGDPDTDILIKTLGLLRNLLSTKPHIDHIMSLHGKQIMQAVILILEGDHAAEVKEQALCILANIADGESAKSFIMSNEDVLKKLTNYMVHPNIKLQIAATFCISNLIWNEEEGAIERQSKLRDMGVQKLLQQMLTTSDVTLFDKVKTALQQFT